MVQQHLSEFHEQLLLLLQNNIQHMKQEEGWDDRCDLDMRELSDLISKSFRMGAVFPLDEILEKYRHLFQIRGPIHLEHQLLQAFQDKTMKDLGLPKRSLLRGLPRVYRKDQPAISRVKQAFSSLSDLRRTAAATAIYSLYRQFPVPKETKVAIVARESGAAAAAERVLKKAFPFLEIALYDGSVKRLEPLCGYDLILQISTAIPGSFLQPAPKVETIGGVGLIESESFCPRSKAHCMGLHFLEVGLLMPIQSSLKWSEAACLWLFKQKDPGPQEIEEYRSRRRFYLADLVSDTGIYVYLHALLKSLEWDAKDIDLCFPDAKHLMRYLAARRRMGKPLFDNSYKLREVVLEVDGYSAVETLSGQGKTLRLFCPDQLSQEDFERYLAFSEEFVGCRGDQSFSEAVFQNKGFFFDIPFYKGFFFRDLLSIAENRIPMHRSTLQILHLFLKIMERGPEQEREWIDEGELQRDETLDLLGSAEAMGLYLQDPDALAGFKKLNKILKEEFCCNDFLIHLLQRAVCHKNRAEIAAVEEIELKRFALGKQPLGQAVRRIREALALEALNH